MVALIALMPQAKARSVLFHCGESSGGSLMEAHVGDEGRLRQAPLRSAALRNTRSP
jgi:hypothetical protein